MKAQDTTRRGSLWPFRTWALRGRAGIAAADLWEFCEDSLIGANVTLHPRYHAAPSAIALPPGSPLQRRPRSRL
jgi:hypothetical protein